MAGIVVGGPGGGEIAFCGGQGRYLVDVNGGGYEENPLNGIRRERGSGHRGFHGLADGLTDAGTEAPAHHHCKMDMRNGLSMGTVMEISAQARLFFSATFLIATDLPKGFSITWHRRLDFISGKSEPWILVSTVHRMTLLLSKASGTHRFKLNSDTLLYDSTSLDVLLGPESRAW